jgi:hypothetical protein
MKNSLKFFGIIAFVVVIGFSMSGCGDDGQGDLLNGAWDRGDIVVTFSGSTGVFTEIKSNSSNWIPLLNNGTVHIGDRKFRNISYDDKLKWTGQELTIPAGSTTSTNWQNTILTISGQTLRVETENTTSPYTTYTRK